MKTSMGVTVFSVCLFAAACVAAPPVNPGGPGHLPPPAPTGFDNASNGLTDDATHQVDQGQFDEFEEISDGLGPLYNAQSCRECHQNPVSGGPSQVLELRVGHKGHDGVFQNPEIPINGGAEVIKGRSLVNQHASLLSFSGDAYLNEMGITNALFPDEVTSLCNTVSEPNNKPEADGLADIDHFTRFVRATKAPARDARQAATPAARQGEALFARIGCEICHVPTLVTAAAGTVVNGGKFAIPEALGNKSFHPYSDYLLHDVGTGDGIAIAMEEHYGKKMYQIKWKNLSLENHHSSANKLRTAPLWGVRTHAMLMHDGASLTFREAILRHRGEASDVTRHFEQLSQADQQAIVEFLKSL